MEKNLNITWNSQNGHVLFYLYMKKINEYTVVHLFYNFINTQDRLSLILVYRCYIRV